MHKVSKLIVILTIFVLLLLNYSSSVKSIAFYTKDFLDTQNDKTKIEGIEFNTKLKTENEESYSVICDVNENNLKLKLNLRLNNQGYLKDSVIYFKSDDGKSLNFEFEDKIENEYLQSFKNNEIHLNRIDSGKEIELLIPIYYKKVTKIEDIEKTIKVELHCNYVDRNGNENIIEKILYLNLGWVESNILKIENNIEKVIQLDENLIIESKINLSKENKNNLLPIKETSIEISDIKLAETLPKNVYIYANSIYGVEDEKLEFSEKNWNYNNGKISIKTENKQENGVYDNENFVDEYIILYVFEGKIEKNLKLKQNIEAKMSTYAANNVQEISNILVSEEKIEKEKGKIVSLEYNNFSSNIEKGILYSNLLKEDKSSIELKRSIEINISSNEGYEEIVLKDTNDYAKDEEDIIKTNINYKEISINKENFKNILGNEGRIQILSKSGEILAEIKSENVEKENSTQTENLEAPSLNGEIVNGMQELISSANINSIKAEETNNKLEENYIIVLPNNTNNLVLKISKPVKPGKLLIKESRTITDLGLNKEQISKVKSLVSEKQVSVTNKLNDSIILEEKTITTNLKEAITQSNLTISPKGLSSISKNENVEIKIELNNHLTSSDMYENPVFEIVMPSIVKELEIKSSSLAYGNGLMLNEISQENRDGRQTIKISTIGKQTEFNSSRLK